MMYSEVTWKQCLNSPGYGEAKKEVVDGLGSYWSQHNNQLPTSGLQRTGEKSSPLNMTVAYSRSSGKNTSFHPINSAKDKSVLLNFHTEFLLGLFFSERRKFD